MGGVGEGIVFLLLGLFLLGGGIVLTVTTGKSVAAGEEGEVRLPGGSDGQSSSAGSSKAVPVIGLILGIAMIIGGIVLLVLAIKGFAA